MDNNEQAARKNKTSLFLIYTCALGILTCLSYAVVTFILIPVQAIAFPEVSKFASLCFLPHGVRVLSTCVLGFRAIPGLFLGSIFSVYFIWGISEPTIYFLIALISSSTCWLVFEGLRALHLNGYYLDVESKMPSFYEILLVGVACSVVNGFLMTALFEGAGALNHVTQTMAAYTLGDTIGLIIVWLAANKMIRTVPLLRK